LFTGKSLDVNIEVFLSTIYPPGSGLAAVKLPVTVEPETEVPKPETFAIGGIFTETLV